MTVFISSTVPVTLQSGIGVTIATPVAPNYTTDDIANPANPNQTLTQMIAAINTAQLVGSVSIDTTVMANTPIFVVPTGKKLYVTAIYFALTAISGSGSKPAISVGFTGSFQDIIDGITHSAMFTTPVAIATVGQIVPVTSFPTLAGSSGAAYVYVPGGKALTANVNSAATYATYTVACSVFGFLTN